MATNKLQWKRIAKGDRLPCQSFLRKKDGEILKLSTIGGVKVGQDCYYLPVDEVINVIKDYPVEVDEDEEIRKELLLDIPKVFPHDKAFRYIAYLEKQGERKHQYKSRPRYVGEGELLGKKAAKIEPKFKVGDKIQYKNKTYTIKEVQENYYVLDNNMSLGFYAQDVWELVEPKRAEIVKPKFKDGDWVVYQNETFQVRSLSNGSLILQGKKYQTYFIAELCRSWTIQDAKDGDVVADKSDGAIGIFQSIGHHPDGGSYNDPSYCFLHCHCDDEFFYADFENGNEIDSDDLVPATKEQRELLFQKMKEAGYEWDAEKKELKQIEQKPAHIDYISRIRKELLDIEDNAKNINGLTESQWVAIRAAHRLLGEYSAKEQKLAEWSEEDEFHFKSIESTIEYCKKEVAENDEARYLHNEDLNWLKSLKDRAFPTPKQEWSKEDENMLDRCINAIQYELIDNGEDEKIQADKGIKWLKSLRPHSHWKPSDEQLYNLSEAAHYRNGFWDCDILIGLYDEIKKLREE